QSESLVVCEVDEQLVERLKKFRFRKETNNSAIIMKIDKDRRLVVLEEEHEGISPDELKDELPERQPRFIVYSYKYQHEDGRVSYPLCFIFSSPVGCKPEQQMMYAGSKNKLVQKAELTKVFEIRNTEDLTEEWLLEKLGFFPLNSIFLRRRARSIPFVLLNSLLDKMSAHSPSVCAANMQKSLK
ncbi:unnamed protein product, partial [Staurois parvus]